MTFNELINFYGSASNAAKSLKTTQSAISKWKERGKIPISSQFKIYYITNHQLDVDKEYQFRVCNVTA